MRIRFTQRVQAETEGRHKGPVYEAGHEMDVSETSAQRWLRRSVAVEVTKAMGRPQAGPKPEAEKAEEVKAEPVEEPKAEAPKAEASKKRGRPTKGDV